MIDKKMRALIGAPLADPCKIYLPEGRRVLPRGPRSSEEACTDGGLRITKAQAADRKAKIAADKLNKLFDYYAGTNLSPEKVAEHLGLYRQQENGVDEKGKPIFVRILDVARAEVQLAWRRKAA